jgi:hypothetical protein
MEHSVSDIFISYAREDEARIQRLVRALEQRGLCVFWDRNIPAGQTWRTHVGKALRDARCVIVAWSLHSVDSNWVAEEADEGKRRGNLVPILLDAVEPPMGFRSIQAADLSDWSPGADSPRFAKFLEDVQAFLPGSPVVTRSNDRRESKVAPSAATHRLATSKPLWRTPLAVGTAAVSLVVCAFFYGIFNQAPKLIPIKITTARPAIAKNLTITNNANTTVKVVAYNPDDRLRWIGLRDREWTLAPGKSAYTTMGTYGFNVFRPGSNKPIAESGDISGDVTISGTYPRIVIRATKRPVTFANNTSENMKLCAYHSDAKALWCQTIKARSSHDWAKAPQTFTLKVFRDGSPDDPVAIEANIPDEASVKIEEGH